jgi:hypothetical protein
MHAVAGTCEIAIQAKMMLHFDRWPFAAMNSRSFEESERWWQACYVPHTIMAEMFQEPHWIIVKGEPGSGKTTALNAVWRAGLSDHNALVVEYPPDRWPENLPDQPAHIERIATLLAEELRNRFHQHPEEICTLNLDQKQFLRWMIEKHKSPRTYQIWLNSLGKEIRPLMDQVEYKEIYPSLKRGGPVGEFIFELLTFCETIGAEQIWILVDCPAFPDPDQIEVLNRLYSWTNPTEHPTFQVIAAMTSETAGQIRFEERVKQRISEKTLDLPEKWIGAVTDRILTVATNGEITQLDQLIDPSGKGELEKIISEEFHRQTLTTWIKMIQTALEYAVDQSLPLEEKDMKAIHRQFCLQHCLIRSGEKGGFKGAWRGGNFIHLNPKEYELLDLLYRCQGDKIPLPSQFNYKDVSRLRQEIEPDPRNPIYLQVEKNEGYWLEKFVVTDKRA